MVRKKSLIKSVQKKLKLKSFKEAKDCFNAVNEAYEEGLKKEGAVKIYNLGIISIGTKKGRNITVPGLKEKVKVPNRLGLFFKVNKDLEKELNSQGK